MCARDFGPDTASLRFGVELRGIEPLNPPSGVFPPSVETLPCVRFER